MVKIELYIQISDVQKKSYKAKNENPSPSRYDLIGQSLWQNPRTMSRYLTKSRY